MTDVREEEVDLRAVQGRLRMAIDCWFEQRLAIRDAPAARLHQAICHAAIGGGKRLRPLLVHASARLFDVPDAYALSAGLAVECIHIHSLIHDDLPCKDDDDLRHGKPTIHRAFDEATAVLAGDSLLALAFETLADQATHPDAAVRIELVGSLARAAGPAGMAGGQMIDVAGFDGPKDIEAISRLQELKTGALLGWSVAAGGILGRACPEDRRALAGYARCLGLAFQIADDLLDHEGTVERTGKRVRKDAKAGKQTFVSLLGASRARQVAIELADDANANLDRFGKAADLLRAIARFAVNRDH